jgi:hypothetical protein
MCQTPGRRTDTLPIAYCSLPIGKEISPIGKRQKIGVKGAIILQLNNLMMKSMVNILPAILILSLIGVTWACNKERATGGSNNTGLRVKSDGYYEYEYDEKGRVEMMTAFNGARRFYYADSAITEVEYLLNGSIADINIYKLNSGKLVYYRQIGKETGYIYSTFYYSSSGALSRQVDTLLLAGGAIIYQYFRSGNRIDSVKKVYNNLTETRIFEYYADRVNTVTNESTGKPYLGSGSPSPVKRELNKINNGSPAVIRSYTYEYDAQNRINKQVITTPNAPTEERVITYY